MITDAKLQVVGVVVADMARALAFYRLLGLDVPAEADTEPHVEVGLPGGLRLAFDTEATIASFHASWKPGVGSARVGLAFALPDPAAVDAAYAQLVGAGHHGELAPFDAFWGMRYATVHDPDGTGVDLFAALPS
jgi:catechol 2,3-dioxygenase-like lactoylglutathione lyase family enzyme